MPLHRQISGLAAIILALAATSTSTSTTFDVCQIIDSKFPGQVGFPNSSRYEESQANYYTADEREVNPSCVFRPASTDDVSRFIKLAVANDPYAGQSALSEPLFAVRSGGHTLWKGAANAQDGVTVDMRGFDSISLSADKRIASIGGGSNFANVYPQLVSHNLTVIGARLPGVSAGGFLSGGGKNFWSRRYGFGCDNIYGYEVVLASGEVVYASAGHNAGLWLALKGGSNNFGIITRYDLQTHPLGLMWGGNQQVSFTPETLDAEAQAFSDIMKPENFDDAADFGILLGYANHSFFFVNSMFYSAPVANPPLFDNFTSINGIESGDLSLSTVADRVLADGSVLPPSVPRSFELVYAFHNADAQSYRTHMQIFQDQITKINAVDGLQVQYLLQPMPVTNGTNVLGLPANDKSLAMWVLTGLWNTATDDDAVKKTLQYIVHQSEALLEEKGLLIPFKYLNYADVGQNPISTYGKDNIAKLWAASKKYDPEGLWQKRVPGVKLPVDY